MLLRELLRDPHLTDYSVVIIDEAHERTLRTDMLLCILRQLQLARTQSLQKVGNQIGDSRPPPLKLVIMSASLDAESFSQYFGGCVQSQIHSRPDCLQLSQSGCRVCSRASAPSGGLLRKRTPTRLRRRRTTDVLPNSLRPNAGRRLDISGR